MSDPVLAASDVTVVRDGRAVLDGVSLSVEPGERLLVQGASGAGKTTLFAVLGLLEPPDEGSVRIRGTDVSAVGESERARLRRDALGFVYQDFRLVPDLTARENAALPQVHGGDRDDDWLDDLFERLGITDVADAYPPTLSGGEKQRVATARALANRPDVVLADEPTGQLDPDSRQRLVDLLTEVSDASDASLLVVSHDRSLVEWFPQVRTLADGQLRARSVPSGDEDST